MNSILNWYVFLWIVSYILPIFSLMHSFKMVISYLIVVMLFKVFLLFSIDHYDLICANLKKNFYNNQNNDNDNLKALKDKSLLACFPHGLFCGGFVMGSNIVENKCISNLVLTIPIFGDICKTIFKSISKDSMKLIMSKGESLSLLPGGFNEIYMMENYKYNIYIPSGFIALAIKYNYTIYPMLSLGENETYNTIPIPKSMFGYLKRFIKVIPIPIIIPFGKWMTFIPITVPIITYYGNPINCENEFMDDKSIENVKDKIIFELQSIFDENIEKYCEYRNNLGILPKVHSSQYSINFYV